MLQASLLDNIPREHVHRSLGHIALMEKNIENAIDRVPRRIEAF